MDLSVFLEMFTDGVSTRSLDVSGSSVPWISLPQNVVLPGVGDPYVIAILFFVVGLVGPLVGAYFMIALFRWIWWGVRLAIIPRRRWR